MMAGAMAMSLAGCGSQETPASAETTGTVQASSEQPQATTEAAETTTDEDMTLDELIAAAQAEASAPDAGTFMVYAPTSRIEKALNAFAEEYGIQGEYYNESGQDLYTKLTTELEAGVKDTADVALLQDSYLFQTQLQNYDYITNYVPSYLKDGHDISDVGFRGVSSVDDNNCGMSVVPLAFPHWSARRNHH